MIKWDSAGRGRIGQGRGLPVGVFSKDILNDHYRLLHHIVHLHIFEQSKE
jgi:D-Tyr-tRNAtyr deacylase